MSAVPRAICDKVDVRDEFRCQRCGVSLEVTSGSRHHRQRRAVAGHLVEDLILLCGSGTTGCHGWAHANPEKARAVGLIVPTWVDDVAAVPVEAVLRSGWWLLHPDGTREAIGDALAWELLDVFGMLPKAVI